MSLQNYKALCLEAWGIYTREGTKKNVSSKVAKVNRSKIGLLERKHVLPIPYDCHRSRDEVRNHELRQ